MSPKSNYCWIINKPVTRYDNQFTKKEEFIIEQPSYPPIKHTLDKKGISYIQVPVEQNGIQIDPILNTNNNILYITPSHQFPTGYVTNLKKEHN